MIENFSNPEQSQEAVDFTQCANMMELMSKLSQLKREGRELRNSSDQVVPLDHIMDSIARLRSWCQQVPPEQRPEALLDDWLKKAGISNNNNLRSTVARFLSGPFEVVDVSGLSEEDIARGKKLGA